MLGVSRKRLISNLGSPNLSNERIGGSISFALHAFNQGVEIFRVHDVKETFQALEAWRYAGENEENPKLKKYFGTDGIEEKQINH